MPAQNLWESVEDVLAMPSTEYFVRRAGTVSGPFTLKLLLAGIKLKKVVDSDSVSTAKNGPWLSVAVFGSITPTFSTITNLPRQAIVILKTPQQNGSVSRKTLPTTSLKATPPRRPFHAPASTSQPLQLKGSTTIWKTMKSLFCRPLLIRRSRVS